MSPKEIFTQSSFWTLNLYIKSYIFCQHLSYVRIRISIPNTDPDSEDSWIRIRIHNTGSILPLRKCKPILDISYHVVLCWVCTYLSMLWPV